jgi:selenocysteine-specific elongation factor
VEQLIGGDEAFALAIDPIYRFLDVTKEDAERILRSVKGLRTIAVDGETFYTTTAKWRSAEERTLKAIGEFHTAHPLAAGREMEELRGKVAADVAPRLFRAFVDALARDGMVSRQGSIVSLPGRRVILEGVEQTIAERVTRALSASSLSPPDVKQLQEVAGAPSDRVVAVLRVLERERQIVRIAPDMYILDTALQQLTADVIDFLSGGATLTPGAFRDRFGTSRKYAIPLLEYLDRAGVTVRVGDGRRLRKEHVHG